MHQGDVLGDEEKYGEKNEEKDEENGDEEDDGVEGENWMVMRPVWREVRVAGRCILD